MIYHIKKESYDVLYLVIFHNVRLIMTTDNSNLGGHVTHNVHMIFLKNDTSFLKKNIYMNFLGLYLSPD